MRVVLGGDGERLGGNNGVEMGEGGMEVMIENEIMILGVMGDLWKRLGDRVWNEVLGVVRGRG